MSGKVVGWAMEQRTGSPAAKLVLVKLADNASEEGVCWPSVPLIIEHTELGQSTVYKHLNELEASGLIRSIDCQVGGDAVVRGYQLSVPALNSPKVKIPPAGKVIPPAGKKIPAAGKAIPAGGIPYKEEPSLEPSLNLAPDAARGLTARVERLTAMIGQAKFDAWFGDARFEDGPPVRVIVPSRLKQGWIGERYLLELQRLFGDDVSVQLATLAPEPREEVLPPPMLTPAGPQP